MKKKHTQVELFKSKSFKISLGLLKTNFTRNLSLIYVSQFTSKIFSLLITFSEELIKIITANYLFLFYILENVIRMLLINLAIKENRIAKRV